MSDPKLKPECIEFSISLYRKRKNVINKNLDCGNIWKYCSTDNDEQYRIKSSYAFLFCLTDKLIAYMYMTKLEISRAD